MNIREIVEAWLKKNGYDGLVGESCGCQIEDLMPCGEPLIEVCQAGYKINCPGDSCPIAEDCISPSKGQVCMTTKKEAKQ